MRLTCSSLAARIRRSCRGSAGAQHARPSVRWAFLAASSPTRATKPAKQIRAATRSFSTPRPRAVDKSRPLGTKDPDQVRLRHSPWG